MFNTMFEYEVDKVTTVLVSASCDDVSTWASNLTVRYSTKDFKPPRDVADDIEKMAVAKLREEKKALLEAASEK